MFDSFASLVANYRGVPGGYRLGHCRIASAALMAKWSPDDREREQHEHSLQHELAYLSEVAKQFMSGNEHKVRLACEDNGYAMEVMIRRTTEGGTQATIIFEMETTTADEASSN